MTEIINNYYIQNVDNKKRKYPLKLYEPPFKSKYEMNLYQNK